MTEDHAPGLERAFVAPADQQGTPRVEGEIPAFLRGTYYLNGPARFERGGQAYRHWLAAAQDAERGGYHSDTFVGMVVSARKPDRASTQSSRGDGELVRLEAVRGDQEVVRGHVGHRDRDQGRERVQQLE